MKVLITDAHLRKAFDIINLFKKNYKDLRLLLAADRHVALLSLIYGQKVYKLSSDNCKRFGADLGDILRRYRTEAVVYLPVEERTTVCFYEFIRDQSPPNLKYLLPEESMFHLARDKVKFHAFCAGNHFPTPRAYSPEDLPLLKKEHRPLILKPASGSGGEGIRRMLTAEETKGLGLSDFSNHLVQDLLENSRHVEGAFFLFDKGRCVRYYSHLRLRTHPADGGVTVFSASGNNPVIRQIGVDVLSKMNWSGLAMIEFLKDYGTGEYKIIELNPRTWGSILLSEFAGARFLINYVYICTGRSLMPSQPLQEKKFIRWIIPFDLLNYLKAKGRIPHFWSFDTGNTCYIGFSYSTWIRSVSFLAFLFLSPENIRKLKKKTWG